VLRTGVNWCSVWHDDLVPTRHRTRKRLLALVLLLLVVAPTPVALSLRLRSMELRPYFGRSL